MIDELRKDEYVLKLISKNVHPTIEDIRPLFKSYNIEYAPQLWELFDLIRTMWHEKQADILKTN